MVKKSADHNDSDAQCDLGIMYLEGKGVEKNEKKAVDYFQKAAEQGHADAQLNLAVSYENGEGIAKDMTKAIIWYCKAVEQGDADAQIQLERLLTDELNSEKAKSDIFNWLQQAAVQNLKFAQNALIKSYSLGLGISQDLKLATYWTMRSGMENSESIYIPEENFHLITFIPAVLKEFPEFDNLKRLKFQQGFIHSENFIAIGNLIRKCKSLELLDLTGITLENSDGLVILQSLKKIRH
jgi:hypothetical protein